MTEPRNLADPWVKFRAITPARIGLERAGDAATTAAHLQFQWDHARARDAVHRAVDFERLEQDLGSQRMTIRIRSCAANRAEYIRRPDLGRRLDEPSRSRLNQHRTQEPADTVFVVADGLSPAAVSDHAALVLKPCLERLQDWSIAPIVLAEQARVALGDEIAMLLNAQMCVVLIGERPGLTIPNSLGIYLTWRPTAGHRDADRNCISNIHERGLSHEDAARRLVWLMRESRRRRISGVALKEDASPELLPLT